MRTISIFHALKTGVRSIVGLALLSVAIAQTPGKTARTVTDPGIVTTRQAITPAGAQSVIDGRVYGVAFGASSDTVYVAARSGWVQPRMTKVYILDWRRNKALEVVEDDRLPGMQGLVLDPVALDPLLSSSLSISAEGKSETVLQLLRVSGGVATVVAGRLGTNAVGGVSVASQNNSAGERYAVVALTYDNALAVIDLVSGKQKGTVNTGIAPFGVAINRGSTVAYVSNWGGRLPGKQDVTAPTGNKPNADQVVVDERGIASTGTVTRVDLVAMKASQTIPVGLHPNALYWDESRARLYVANSNSDSVSVINTETNVVTQTIPIQPFERSVSGIAPNGLVGSRDGKTLYVACGGINAVAVIRVADGQIEGLIPTAWYPNDVRMSSDGEYLVVANLLGVGPGGAPGDIERVAKDDPSFLAPADEDRLATVPGPTRRYVDSNRSSIQVIPVPDPTQLAGYTTAVAENNHLPLRLTSQSQPINGSSAAPQEKLPVPIRAGDPSAIDNVVFIIKENRTYDQVFGDLSQANSDPTLLVYGPDVTPNHHRLAEQFVVLDNFYASGGNSADGHQWLTQAAETDYCYWPGYAGRSYPFEGSDPIAPASSGFIWDAALGRKKTVLVFGEYVGIPATSPNLKERSKMLAEWKDGADFSRRFNIVAPLAPLNKILAKDYPYFDLAVPDVVRAQIFLKHLSGWEKDGRMPNLVIVQLPSDHTGGTLPEYSTPKAAVADNDLALGQIVDRLSKSRFWKSMAIFVVEDDAIGGLDHVDGHRTVALAVSPYIRRGSVDSTFYSHPSILKTIELMLGLPTLSLFDLIANDMRNSFRTTPDFTPYTAVIPKHSLFEVNPPANALKGPSYEAALASTKMNFAVPDDVPWDVLNRILWHDARGWECPYPTVRNSVFAPYPTGLFSVDEKEEAER
ncbi:MAG: bifunctional YncE family protein/alkaline phosphatase family protein [Acidobacteria bacterium]|nr:bifunctional YncE family protein/alkaline phosphatase family protein [Acidobacteriota bacterium]